MRKLGRSQGLHQNNPVPLLLNFAQWWKYEHMEIELISTQEAAELAGQSVATINRWATSGKLTPVHKGKGIRGAHIYKRTDLEALIKDKAPAK